MKQKRLIALALLLALLLSGCGQAGAAAPAATPAPTETPEIVPTPEPVVYKHEYAPDSREVSLDSADAEDLIAQAERLTKLQRITLNDTVTDLSAVQALQAAFPDAELQYTVTVCGSPVSSTETTLDLQRLGSADTDAAVQALALLPGIQRIQLSGETMSFADVGKFQALPSAPVVDYPFTLYDIGFSTADSFMDLNHVRIYDHGEALRQVLPYMTACKQVDMEYCGIPDEEMAALRAEFPDTKIVWRIWFSIYNCRTDETRILASIRGMCLTAAACEALKYCNEVKYLDVGHNTIEDISFVSYMPELEVAIVAINYWSDATPLASCPKLEYLEMYNTQCTDLTPLAGLKNLKHLNLGWNYNLTDITPLYGLTGLERLWIGSVHSIPQEQLDEIQRRLPNTRINITTPNPTEEGWRDDPRYDLLSEQLGYNLPDPYTY